MVQDDTVNLLLDNRFVVPTIAEDSDQLLQLLEEPSVVADMFLTDLHMPRMNGFELTKLILTKWLQANVVIFSFDVEICYIEEAKKVGAAFLHKIIDHKNIIEA